MSAMGQERTSPVHLAMSALPPKADIDRRDRHVRFVPKADSCTAARLTGSRLTSRDHLVGAVEKRQACPVDRAPPLCSAAPA